VGVAQGNVGIQQKHAPERARAIHDDLRALTGQHERRGAELTVWAETAYPYPWVRERAAQHSHERRVVDAHRQASLQRGPTDGELQRGPTDSGVRGPVLIGLVTYAQAAGSAVTTRYNSAWLVRPDGWLGDRVDKSRLLAFGEYVPLWDLLPPLRSRYPSRGFQAGRNDVVRARGHALGILICYEDLFGSLAREVVARGADVLVNMTNDAWFGRSREPALHDMVARLRAIETRRDLVRAVNTGVSSFSSASGRLLRQTRTFTRDGFVAEVRPLQVRTLYAVAGDWLTPLVGLGLAGAWLRARARRTQGSGGMA
jgi:apolipoprotein N-acyltransferase